MAYARTGQPPYLVARPLQSEVQLALFVCSERAAFASQSGVKHSRPKRCLAQIRRVAAPRTPSSGNPFRHFAQIQGVGVGAQPFRRRPLVVRKHRAANDRDAV